MPRFREFVFGPWRAVPVLGVTQILAWGSLFYPAVLTMPLIASERGWSLAFAMGGFSVGLLVTALIAPTIGGAIDRYGGHIVMPIGALLGAAGLVLLTYAAHPAAYMAVWMLLGIAIAASLYDPAFATLGRIFGAAARRPITALTLIGGFASTVCWPATHFLLEWSGWRGAYLVFAALLAFVAAPLLAFALPRSHAHTGQKSHADPNAELPSAPLPAKGWPFFLVASGFAIYAFVPSGLAAHLLAIFQRQGVAPETVVAIGALFGPAQVGARICEMIFARNLHPLYVVRIALAIMLFGFALLAVFGFSIAVAALFAILFGAANGLVTITRGAVPLALFGAAGYGRVLGRIAKPYQAIQASAPLVLAFVVERASDASGMALAALCTLTGLLCFLALKRPRG
jgi:MFS family permease